MVRTIDRGSIRLRRCGLVALGLWLFSSPLFAALPNTQLRLGVIAERAHEPDRMLRVYADLLAALRTRLVPRGIEVAPLVIASDLGDLARRLKRGEVDMVIESVFPTLTLQAQSAGRILPRLVIVRRGQREYRTVFFARKTGGITSLDDLRGRTLVLQAARSTSAFAVPRAELAQRGITTIPAGQSTPPGNATFFLLAGAELNQAIWVLSGKGDAGAFNEGDWANLPGKVRSELMIFHETSPLLRGLLSFRSGLDQVTRRACEEILQALPQDTAGKAALARAAGITRFEPLTRKDLANLDAWRRTLMGVPSK